VPGAIMLCSEWWAYEILAIFASLIGTAEVAAQSIMLQMVTLSFMIPLGISITCASVVGNAIGASNPKLAKKFSKVSIYYSFIIEIFIGIIMLYGGNDFVSIFSTDIAVKKYTEQAMPYLSVLVVADGLQRVMCGVLRGSGKQTIGAITNFLAFYAIGLPMSWYFCFTLKMNVSGLLLGVGCGTLFQVLVLFIMIFNFQSYIYSSSIVTNITSVDNLEGIESNIKLQELKYFDDNESSYYIKPKNGIDEHVNENTALLSSSNSVENVYVKYT
jgi:MATE family multidrug resistance protein